MKIKRFIKKENGSITMTVLASMLFITTALVVSYFSIANQSSNQNNKVSKIEKQYSVTDAELEERYNQRSNNLNSISYMQINQIKSLGNIMLGKETNTETADEYGNKIVIPAGFKITDVDEYGNAVTIPENFQKADRTNNVIQGVVIEDKDGNQFVWIPVGNIRYEENGESRTKTINLGRYDFTTEGIPSTYSGLFVEENATDISSLKNYGNAISKNISEFISKTNIAKGYYIGRYEARNNSNGKLTEKCTDNVWNAITQINASNNSKNMYSSNNNFESDLINSYAWDTAIVFFQEFEDPDYSRKTSINTGAINSGVIESVCNVYDMAGNCREWTTETANNESNPCVRRGGGADSQLAYTCYRGNKSISNAQGVDSFRPILYIK